MRVDNGDVELSVPFTADLRHDHDVDTYAGQTIRPEDEGAVGGAGTDAVRRAWSREGSRRLEVR